MFSFIRGWLLYWTAPLLITFSQPAFASAHANSSPFPEPPHYPINPLQLSIGKEHLRMMLKARPKMSFLVDKGVVKKDGLIWMRAERGFAGELTGAPILWSDDEQACLENWFSEKCIISLPKTVVVGKSANLHGEAARLQE